jgi:hypothetical protein
VTTDALLSTITSPTNGRTTSLNLEINGNTQGVCHQLSNEFELKHGKLGGDEDIKAKSINMSPT